MENNNTLTPELKEAFEEIADKYSYYIGDSLSDFEMVYGRSVILPGDIQMMLHAAHTLGRDAEKWISVSEMLPTHGEDFNVVLDLQDNMGPPVSGIMEFDGVKKLWVYPGTDVVCDCVTHWQPLPPSPLR